MCNNETTRPRRGRRAAAALATALCCLSPLLASSVRMVNLEEMTGRAERILSARCVDYAVVHNPELGFDVAHVTLQVDSSLKGAVDSSLTLRMLAGGADSWGGSGVTEIPGFAPGEKVILFLYGESRLGLTSPVGLGQGKFTVLTNKEGREIAVNGFGTASLFRHLSQEALTCLGDQTETWKGREGIPPTVLLDMVRSLEP
jgi:hypothetical protein